MQDDLKNTPRKVVGYKQLMRELEADNVGCVYVAEDAEPALRQRIKAAAAERSIVTVPVHTMEELGEACGIDVGAACAGIKKDN